jgi:hypothetical protein
LCRGDFFSWWPGGQEGTDGPGGSGEECGDVEGFFGFQWGGASLGAVFARGREGVSVLSVERLEERGAAA